METYNTYRDCLTIPGGLDWELNHIYKVLSPDPEYLVRSTKPASRVSDLGLNQLELLIPGQVFNEVGSLFEAKTVPVTIGPRLDLADVSVGFLRGDFLQVGIARIEDDEQGLTMGPGLGNYDLYVSETLAAMGDSAQVLLFDTTFRTPQPEDERESLISEYQKLTELELNEGLDLRAANRLREIEEQLDKLDLQEPTAVNALIAYDTDIAKLRELNAIAERLKALL